MKCHNHYLGSYPIVVPNSSLKAVVPVLQPVSLSVISLIIFNTGAHLLEINDNFSSSEFII